MVFALTNELQVFKPGKPKMAVDHAPWFGPCFIGALGLEVFMNKTNGGASNTKSHNDHAEYKVTEDAQGACVLTGSSHKDEYGNFRFTCVELEVFLLE